MFALMKIFSKRTDPKIQTVEQLIERQAQLTAMRSDAQAELHAALAERQSHLLVGNVEEHGIVATLQARADKVQTMLVGLDDAIAALATQIADAAAARAAEQRRIQAEANAKELAVIISKVEKVLPAWIATAREMSGLLDSLNNFRYQVGGVANYLGGVAAQTEAGVRVVLNDLNDAVGPVARGEQAIQIGKASPMPAVAATAALTPKDHFTYTTPNHASATYVLPGGFSKEINR